MMAPFLASSARKGAFLYFRRSRYTVDAAVSVGFQVVVSGVSGSIER